MIALANIIGAAIAVATAHIRTHGHHEAAGPVRAWVYLVST